MAPRPWYKPYWTTIFIVAAMIGVLGWANFHQWGSHDADFGWPTIACTQNAVVSWPLLLSGSTPVWPKYYEYSWNAAGLIIDSFAFIFVAAAVAYVAEAWRRRAVRPWQFDLRFTLVAITVACVLYGLHGRVDELYYQVTSNDGWLWFLPPYNSYDWIGVFPWYFVIPLLLGECCFVYVAAWFAYYLGIVTVHRLHWTTILATTLVGVILIYANGLPRPSRVKTPFPGGGFSERSDQGWPANALTAWRRYDLTVTTWTDNSNQKLQSEDLILVAQKSEWRLLGCLLDALLLPALLVATAVGCEYWHRITLRRPALDSAS
jgi:hypothetical protein